MLADLAKLDPHSEEFADGIGRLKVTLLAHAISEEQSVFPHARDAVREGL